MKFCSRCGNQLMDMDMFCPRCGCAAAPNNAAYNYARPDGAELINKLAQRLNTNGIIWLVIGILQVLGGIYGNWGMLIVGVLNIISSVQDMQYSKILPQNPRGIVAKFEPLTGPIIALVYNLVIGGVIGVAGSIYYFVAIRNYVMENRNFFASLDM